MFTYNYSKANLTVFDSYLPTRESKVNSLLYNFSFYCDTASVSMTRVYCKSVAWRHPNNSNMEMYVAPI